MEKVYIETLGCPRNLADSEVLAGMLESSGYEITNIPEDAGYIIVNTCGFIEDAINESVDVILSLAEYKKTGNCRFLVVAGCLAQRFKNELAKELTEADFFAGTGAYSDLPGILKDLDQGKNKQNYFFPDPRCFKLPEYDDSKIVSTYPYAYLKIAEGCARHCTFCIIPELRGPLRSRSPENIIKEAEKLAEAGIKEIVLVSQETTDYGKDFKNSYDFSSLLTELSNSVKDVRIRFMYGHPLTINKRLIETVAKNPNICSYFDIPVQHASDEILKKMGRGYDSAFLINLFSEIRENIKDAVLRTTLITGFPGETDEDFKKLCDFMEEVKFDHAGVFTYSEMDDLPSFHLKNKVDPETAEQRRTVLMEKQALISQEINYTYCGKTLPVLIDGKDSEEFYAGRTVFQAPEVDGITYVDSKSLNPGDIVNVYITDAYDYDLAGNG
ncbi:MAG: 30S ribosomal protein S12 methylthiotransferase RimO [Thermodesulfobacteriota bacterium]